MCALFVCLCHCTWYGFVESRFIVLAGRCWASGQDVQGWVPASCQGTKHGKYRFHGRCTFG